MHCSQRWFAYKQMVDVVQMPEAVTVRESGDAKEQVRNLRTTVSRLRTL